MTKSDLCKEAGVSASTIDRAVRDGLLPQPGMVPVAGRFVAVFDDAVAQHYIKQRKMLAVKPTEMIGFSRNGNGDASMMRRVTEDDALVKLTDLIAGAVTEILKTERKAPVMNLDQKMVLSLREAARVTGIPPRRLIDAWNRGELKGFKNHLRIGRGYRFRKTDLQRYIRTFGRD